MAREHQSTGRAPEQLQEQHGEEGPSLPYADNLATNLRMERARLRLTQKEVADGAGITTAMLCHYEQGTSTPSLKTVERLADYFGVTLDQLMGRDL